MLSQMNAENNFNFSFQTQLASMQLKLKNFYVGFSAQEKINFDFRYNKQLIDFILHGNGAFLGQEIHPSFGINFNHYREYGFLFGKKINDKFSFGTRIKLVSGLQNIQTKAADFTLKTDAETFALTALPNMEINTSGFGDNITKTLSFNDYFFTKSNKGLAVDLGATYECTSHITFSASVVDWGYINWKNDVTNYSRLSKTNFTYNGIDLNKFINDSTNLDKSFKQFLDSLTGSLHIDTLHNSYKAPLPTQFYFNTDFKLNEKNKASLLIYSRSFNHSMYHSFAFSYTKKLSNWLEASANYAIINKTYNNIGLGIALKGNAVQYYMVSDNVMGIFFPQNANNINLRFGFNFVFGK
jgi:hypothetical protein